MEGLSKEQQKIFPQSGVRLMDRSTLSELKNMLERYKNLNKLSAKIASKMKYVCAVAIVFSVGVFIATFAAPMSIGAWVLLGGKVLALIVSYVSLVNAFFKAYDEKKLKGQLEKLASLHSEKLQSVSDGSFDEGVIELCRQLTVEMSGIHSNLSFVNAEKIDGFKKIMNADIKGRISQTIEKIQKTSTSKASELKAKVNNFLKSF